MPEKRLIIALGGGGFQLPPDNGLLDDFLVATVRERSGRDRPRVCFLPTAWADSEATIAAFHAAYDNRAETSVLTLFDRVVDDIDAFLLAQDLVFIAGGNTANMLAIWRIHGVERALVAAWRAGVAMSGVSAGGICWFEGFTTDSAFSTDRSSRTTTASRSAGRSSTGSSATGRCRAGTASTMASRSSSEGRSEPRW